MKKSYLVILSLLLISFSTAYAKPHKNQLEACVEKTENDPCKFSLKKDEKEKWLDGKCSPIKKEGKKKGLLFCMVR